MRSEGTLYVTHATIPVSDTRLLSNQRHVRKGDEMQATVDIKHLSSVDREMVPNQLSPNHRDVLDTRSAEPCLLVCSLASG